MISIPKQRPLNVRTQQNMKSKLSLFTILGLVACCWAGFAQNNEPAPTGDNNAAGDQAVQPATPPTTDSTAAKPDAAPAGDNAAAAPAKLAEAPASAAAPLVAANEPVKADAPKADAAKPEANAPANAGTTNTGAVIPLIVMDDVALTDAIK